MVPSEAKPSQVYALLQLECTCKVGKSYSIIKPHFTVSPPPQCRSQAVVWHSTPRMYPCSGYFLVTPNHNFCSRSPSSFWMTSFIDNPETLQTWKERNLILSTLPFNSSLLQSCLQVYNHNIGKSYTILVVELLDYSSKSQQIFTAK